MTPSKKEIMRIYLDGIYSPPDMNEKPGGLQIKGSGIRDGRSCSLQTALHPPVVEAAEPDDSEYIGELGYPGHIGKLGYP